MLDVFFTPNLVIYYFNETWHNITHPLGGWLVGCILINIYLENITFLWSWLIVPAKNYKIRAFAGRLWSLSREGSLSCHTCVDTEPQVLRLSSEGPPNLVALGYKNWALTTISKLDPHRNASFWLSNSTLYGEIKGRVFLQEDTVLKKQIFFKN